MPTIIGMFFETQCTCYEHRLHTATYSVTAHQ